MRIAALVQSSTSVARLRSALTGRRAPIFFSLAFHTCWEDLINAGAEGSFDVCFVDPCFGGAGPPRKVRALELEGLRQAVGAAAVVLYMPVVKPQASVLADLGSMDFPFLVTRDLGDDPDSILRVLARSQVRRAAQRAWSQPEEPPADTADPILIEAAASWPPANAVGDLARKFLSSESAMRRTCKELEIAPPRTLLRWNTALEAHSLRCLGVGSLGRIAQLVGLSGISSLDRLVCDLTGSPISDFLQDACLEQTLRAYRSQVRRAAG